MNCKKTRLTLLPAVAMMAALALVLAGCSGGGDTASSGGNSGSTTKATTGGNTGGDGAIGLGGGEAAFAGKIKIGVAGPFTGGSSVYGDMIWGAAQVAAFEINKEQKGVEVDGKRYEIEFVKGDDQAKNDQAGVIANGFANNPEICLVIGHFNSACSKAGKPIYNEAKLVEFSPGSTNVDVCVDGPYTFRNLYRDDYQGSFLADFAQNALKAKKVGVFYDNDDYGIGLKNSFAARAKEIGLEIYAEVAYTREQTLDFSSGIDKFGAAGLDAIFIGGLYEGAGMIAKTAREKGITVPILAGDGVDSPGLIEGAGDAADGVIVTSPFLFTDDNPAATEFSRKFTTINGEAPDTWAALTYDAIMMSVDGVRAVGPDREKLRDWLATHDSEAKGWLGITGNTYFDENGDCPKPAYTKIVKDGAFETYTPDSDE